MLLHLHRVLKRLGFPRSHKRERVALLWVMDWTLGRDAHMPDLNWIEFQRYDEPAFDHPAFQAVQKALIDADASFAILDCRYIDRIDLSPYDLVLVPAGPDLPEACATAIGRLPADERRKLWIVGSGPGFTLPGVPVSDTATLLAKQEDLFFPAGPRPGAPLRTFVHASSLGEILFAFNRGDRDQSFPVPPTSRGYLVDGWFRTAVKVKPGLSVTVPAAGQAVLVLTDNPQAIVGAALVKREFE
jgi:hypothetical protein